MLNILLVGRVTDSKFSRISNAIREKLKARNIQSDIEAMNLYNESDISIRENGRDVVVYLAPGTIASSLPVIEGLGLVYPQMGSDKAIEELVALHKANN